MHVPTAGDIWPHKKLTNLRYSYTDQYIAYSGLFSLWVQIFPNFPNGLTTWENLYAGQFLYSLVVGLVLYLCI